MEYSSREGGKLIDSFQIGSKVWCQAGTYISSKGKIVHFNANSILNREGLPKVGIDINYTIEELHTEYVYTAADKVRSIPNDLKGPPQHRAERKGTGFTAMAYVLYANNTAEGSVVVSDLNSCPDCEYNSYSAERAFPFVRRTSNLVTGSGTWDSKEQVSFKLQDIKAYYQSGNVDALGFYYLKNGYQKVVLYKEYLK
jgi:hypothetical protein